MTMAFEVCTGRVLFYFDRCMPMDCANSCRTFEIFSTTVEWVARHKLKIDHIIHLLDDFLIVASDRQLCQSQLDLFIDLCSYVSIPIATQKTFSPLTTLSFVGIELDSVRMRLVCLLISLINVLLFFWNFYIGRNSP